MLLVPYLLYALLLICHALLRANVFACILALVCSRVYGGLQISLHIDEFSTTVERLMYVSVLLVSPGLYLAKYVFDKLL